MKLAGMGLAALGLVSNALVAIAPARALPDNQIVEKLQGIPVFTITDASGAPLTATTTAADGKQSNFAGAYFSRKEAQAFLQVLQKKDPELYKKLQIRAVRLSELYNVQFNASGDRRLDISYVPSAQQVTSALGIVQKKDRNIKNFNGVPLFVGRAGKPSGYITVDSNGKKVIPLFFDKEQLQPYIDQFKKSRPELASTAEIQVITLEGLIDSLRTKSSDPRADALYSQVVLYPSREAIDMLDRSTPTQPSAAPSRPNSASPTPPAMKPKPTPRR
jgi:hypothetical protein